MGAPLFGSIRHPSTSTCASRSAPLTIGYWDLLVGVGDEQGDSQEGSGPSMANFQCHHISKLSEPSLVGVHEGKLICTVGGRESAKQQREKCTHNYATRHIASPQRSETTKTVHISPGK